MKPLDLLLLILSALGAIRSNGPEPSVSTEVDAAASGALEQTESIFAYEVIERAADRTIDDLRGIDANVNGLLAVQAALYAILIDSFNPHVPLSWLVPGLFLIAICMNAWNLRLGRGANVPEPRAFRQALIDDTSAARDTVIDVLLATTESNDALRRSKRTWFYAAITVTLVAALLAPFLRQPSASSGSIDGRSAPAQSQSPTSSAGAGSADKESLATPQ